MRKIEDGIAIGSAFRPSIFGEPRRKKTERLKSNVEKLVERYRRGQDIWTGEKLTGPDEQEWLDLVYKGKERDYSEAEVVRILLQEPDEFTQDDFFFARLSA